MSHRYGLFLFNGRIFIDTRPNEHTALYKRNGFKPWSNDFSACREMGQCRSPGVGADVVCRPVLWCLGEKARHMPLWWDLSYLGTITGTFLPGSLLAARNAAFRLYWVQVPNIVSTAACKCITLVTIRVANTWRAQKVHEADVH